VLFGIFKVFRSGSLTGVLGQSFQSFQIFVVFVIFKVFRSGLLTRVLGQSFQGFLCFRSFPFRFVSGGPRSEFSKFSHRLLGSRKGSGRDLAQNVKSGAVLPFRKGLSGRPPKCCILAYYGWSGQEQASRGQPRAQRGAPRASHLALSTWQL
jgi:hypothetical protein